MALTSKTGSQMKLCMTLFQGNSLVNFYSQLDYEKYPVLLNNTRIWICNLQSRTVVNKGHSMSGDPQLYIWPWAKSMKFHKQRSHDSDLKTFWIFKIKPLFTKLWLVKICSVLIWFLCIFLWIWCSDIKTLVSFLSVTIFSWKFVRMCQKVCLLKTNHWYFPYDLWT